MRKNEAPDGVLPGATLAAGAEPRRGNEQTPRAESLPRPKCGACGKSLARTYPCAAGNSGAHVAARKAYRRDYYRKNADVFIRRQMAWDAANPECVRRRRRKQTAHDVSTPELKARKNYYTWKAKIRKRFGGKLPTGPLWEMLLMLRKFRLTARAETR